ncbi:protein NPAT isoform X2 [Grammomys surdaster]|uniref:protein NPAT isoform X2 n=1 Tax=Grammomys surdaster TaxID=491861 RepID=UPI00109F56FF|nr:protein NPAT isoform X2 [Grammomys surdaster]
MLLPSDVARLVLGYLQQENLTSTCQTFILESSNLKEYAEHCTDEGFIPACLLSLFGKNLTTILNEYVAMKAKETSNDVPTIMSSLWKKLDHTLSQIRSMQSSPGFAAHQRARTRNGIAEIKRQRWLASQAAPVSSELLVLPYASGQFTTSPLVATQAIKPAGQISTPARSNIVVVNQSQPQNTVTNTAGESLNIIPGPQERKTQTSLMSPGRRKSESQKKSFTSSGPHSSRNFQDPNAFAVEKQMVIENAREKILNNKSLQEKLAENINKFLTSDSSIAQVPKQTDSHPTEPETSIDELLGLPSEIHMSEEAIQDILEQTESDPAFQALFDLFDYGKTKNNKNISQSVSSPPMETNPNIVLPEETNLTIRSSFETEESDGQSGQPPFCTSYQNEDVLLNDLKSGNSHDVLPQESQENFSQITSNIQKKTFKTAVPAEQKCALDITFESMSNLSDFNQRGSSTECNEHCSELYTSQMPTEAEVAVGEKNSLSPDILNQSQYQPDQPNVPVTSFVSLGGETNDKNLILSGKNPQLLSQSTPLTAKPSKSQFCENSNNIIKVKTNSHGSESPDSSETQNSKIETNSVSPVAAQPQPDCQGNSPLQSKTSPVIVEGLGVNVTEKIEIHLEEPAPSDKQISNDSASVDLNPMESKTKPLQSENAQEPPVKDGDTIFLSLSGHNSCEEVALVPREDAELNNAVSSISGENLPTIILSSKSPAKNAEFVTCLSSEESASAVVSVEVGDSGSMEQNLLVLKPEEPMVNNTQNEDGITFSANIAPCVPKDGGYIQLMPATSTAFGNSSNILIATCMTDPTALGPTVSQSNVVVLPGSSAPMTAQPPLQQLQTPPKSNSAFAVSQAVSPNFSQGSAIIIASPVQPVLQGMVGMIPVSVVGQNGNTFSTPPQQVLHMPLAAPVCNRSVTQFPISQKSQKAQGLRNKPITGKQVNNLTNLSSLSEACHTQRTEASDKNIATELGKKLEDTTISLSAERVAPPSKPFESHRRVLCFDSAVSSVANTQGPLHKITSQNKEKKETSIPRLDSPILSSTLKPPPNNAIKREREKTVPKILSKSETASSRHTTMKEVQSEKKVSPTEMTLESFHKTTANKENELCGDGERPKNPDTSKLPGGQQNASLRSEKAIASLQELTKKQATPSNNKNTTSVGGTVKDQKQEQSKPTSSLTGVEILQDVPLHSPANRIADTDLPVPRTPGSGAGEKHKEPSESMKAPASRRCAEEVSIPRVMVPPVTADLPACSPASETGSENSVSMAAHTLMILSRAAIARTTATPLKDNTQQFRTSSRSTTKKRKIEELDECERNSRTSSKNLANSSVPVKKKKIKKKKLPSSFPAGMDVDKFLLSLHYDE